MKCFGRINVPRKEKEWIKKCNFYLPQCNEENATNNDSVDTESGETVFLDHTNKKFNGNGGCNEAENISNSDV
jgi:hypothetical protein